MGLISFIEFLVLFLAFKDCVYFIFICCDFILLLLFCLYC